jgi:hypothetical protein
VSLRIRKGIIEGLWEKVAFKTAMESLDFQLHDGRFVDFLVLDLSTVLSLLSAS